MAKVMAVTNLRVAKPTLRVRWKCEVCETRLVGKEKVRGSDGSLETRLAPSFDSFPNLCTQQPSSHNSHHRQASGRSIHPEVEDDDRVEIETIVRAWDMRYHTRFVRR